MGLLTCRGSRCCMFMMSCTFIGARCLLVWLPRGFELLNCVEQAGLAFASRSLQFTFGVR